MKKRFLKSIFSLFLIGIIIFCLFFVLFKIRGNFFDSKYRDSFTKYPTFRIIFSLHDYGDGKYDYLNSEKYPKLTVEIDELPDYKTSSKVKQSLKEKLKTLCQKEEVEIIEDSKIYDSYDSYSEKQTKSTEKLYRDNKTSRDTAVLHILYLNKSEEQPDIVGTTISETSIAIFKENIINLAGPEDDKIALEESTIIHEFGHLLGLKHTDEKYSIMFDEVEIVNGEVDRRTLWFSESDLAKIEEERTKINNNKE